MPEDQRMPATARESAKSPTETAVTDAAVRSRHIVMVSQIPLWSMGKAVGGPAFHSTVNALAERFRVSLVAPRLDYVDPADLPEGVTLHQFEHRLHGLWRQVRKLGWVTDTLGWYTFRRDAQPIVDELCAKGDVDLLYGYEIYGVPVVRRAATRFKLPMVARYQGSLMSTRRHERLAWLRYWKHLQALKTPADLIVMTDDGTLGDELLRDLGHSAERVRFWMNGADFSIRELPSRDVRGELGIPPERKLLLTVSRLSYWKRVDRAIRALAELLARGVDAQLVIVGVGPEEAKLRTLAEELGVTDRVLFAGGVARPDLPSYYRSADVLLSLYDYSNLGNPAIEAIVLGRPVVALNVGGTDHLVHDGVNGLLVDDAGPASVADAVQPLLEDRARAEDLGRRAGEWADGCLWTWRQRMDAEIEALEELMASR